MAVIPPTAAPEVVLLDHGRETGGAQLAAVELLHALVPRWSVRAVVDGPGPYEEALRAAGVTTSRLGLPARLGTARRSDSPGAAALASAVVACGRVLRACGSHRRRRSVLYLNSPKALLLALPLLLARRPPAVFHVRDVLSSAWIASGAVRRLLGVAARLCDVVVASSETAAAAAPVPAAVVSSPVAAEFFGPTVPVPDGPPVFVMAGRLDPWKGQSLFLEAFAAVLRTRPDAVAVVVGGPLFGRTAYADGLREQARQLGIEGSVRWTGHVPSIRPYLDAARVAVVATLGVEPHGQTVVQALARGRAVVAPAAGGPAELLTDGVDGVLFRPGDADDLHRALLRALDLPREEAGLAARGAAEAHHPGRTLSELEDLLRAALHRERTGGRFRPLLPSR